MGPTHRPRECCDCEPSIEGRRLRLDTSDCAGRGRVATAPACRATAIAALDASIVAIETDSSSRTYRHGEGTVGVLVAAARFAALVVDHDGALARRAHREPLGAAR